MGWGGGTATPSYLYAGLEWRLLFFMGFMGEKITVELFDLLDK